MVRGVGQRGITGGGQDAMVPDDFLDFEQVINSRRFRRHPLRLDG